MNVCFHPCTYDLNAISLDPNTLWIFFFKSALDKKARKIIDLQRVNNKKSVCTGIKEWFSTTIYFFSEKLQKKLFFPLPLIYESKKEGKDQESIQSSTTPDPGYQWELFKAIGWLSGRVLDLRQRGCRFEPYRHWGHCLVTLILA